MQYRAPSTGLPRASHGLNFRRRSGGAFAFADKSSFYSDDEPSFPAQLSARHEQRRSLMPRTKRLSRSLSPDSRVTGQSRSEDDGGYHVYSSVSASEGVASRNIQDSRSRFPGIRPSSSLRQVYAEPPENTEGVLDYSASLRSSDDMLYLPEDEDSRIALPDSSVEESCKSPMTEGTSIFVDSDHGAAFLPLIETTSKFTRKWPQPTNMKNFELRNYKVVNGGAVIEGVDPTLEEGQGLALIHSSKWTPFKACLLVSVMTVFAYGSAGLLYAVMTWFNTWQKADVMVVADYDILIVVTMCSSLLVFTALVGISGTLLNSRPILAVYTVLLWPALLSILAIGYTSYKRANFSLDRKLNVAWGQFYTPQGKQIIQDSLQCCGFYNAMHEASPTRRCYLRSPLPGCRAAFFDFESHNLGTVWKWAFSVAGFHLVNMVIALLSANHINNIFGKGITPRRYRLSPEDVKADADRILGGVGGKVVLLEKGYGEASKDY